MSTTNTSTRTRAAAGRAAALVVLAFALALAAAAALAPARALAAEPSGDLLSLAVDEQAIYLDQVDQSAKCSYAASVYDLAGNPMQGVSVRAWRVAQMKEGFPLVAELADLPMTYDPAAPGFSWQDVAETLRGVVDLQGVSPAASDTTGEDGRVRFEGLEPGVYLIVTDASSAQTADGQVYTFRPVIATLPSVLVNEGKAEFGYDVDADMDKYAPQSEDDVIYSVRKVWDGDAGHENARPTVVTVDLFRSAGGDYELYDTVKLSESNNWTYEWTSDVKYNWAVAEESLGVNYTYSVHSDRNFEVTPAEAVFTVTNTYSTPGDGSVWFQVNKAWDDQGNESKRPDALPVQIYRDGTLADQVNLRPENGWTYRWHAEPGHVWSVVENLPDSPYDHKVLTEGDGNTGQVFNITNTYAPGDSPATVSYEVTKAWADQGHEGSRPGNVKVRLICDGKDYSEVELNASNDWHYAWTYEKGHVWTVAETAVPAGYVETVASEGGAKAGYKYTVTNTYPTPGTRGAPTPTRGSQSSLPQTGDVWWPVAPLACVGMAFLMIALVAGRRRRREE